MERIRARIDSLSRHSKKKRKNNSDRRTVKSSYYDRR